MKKAQSITVTLLKRVSIISFIGLLLLGLMMLHEYQEIAAGAEGASKIADELLLEFIEEFGWILIAIFGGVLGAIIFTIRSSLRPLMQVSEEAGQLGPENMEMRLTTGHVPVEILPLVERVNEALDRLEFGYRQQREFTADVAHELRTPLAVLRSRVETGEAGAQSDMMLVDLERINRLISQLLKASQLDNLILQPGEKADLDEVCERVVSDLAMLAIKDNKMVALDNPLGNIKVHGLEEALYQAVRNLTENALRHTADGTTVTVGLSQSGDNIRVEVRDFGPGLPVQETGKLFERFWREDQKGEGAGLGLSIVAKIMELHGGSVDAADAPEGGAIFSLSLPATTHGT